VGGHVLCSQQSGQNPQAHIDSNIMRAVQHSFTERAKASCLKSFSMGDKNLLWSNAPSMGSSVGINAWCSAQQEAPVLLTCDVVDLAIHCYPAVITVLVLGNLLQGPAAVHLPQLPAGQLGAVLQDRPPRPPRLMYVLPLTAAAAAAAATAATAAGDDGSYWYCCCCCHRHHRRRCCCCCCCVHCRQKCVALNGCFQG